MSALPLCHTIARGAFVRVSMAAHHRVTVIRGRVWATAMNNPADYMVGPGESATITGGELLIEAMQDSVVMLEDVSAPRIVARPAPHLLARP